MWILVLGSGFLSGQFILMCHLYVCFVCLYKEGQHWASWRLVWRRYTMCACNVLCFLDMIWPEIASFSLFPFALLFSWINKNRKSSRNEEDIAPQPVFDQWFLGAQYAVSIMFYMDHIFTVEVSSTYANDFHWYLKAVCGLTFHRSYLSFSTWQTACRVHTKIATVMLTDVVRLVCGGWSKNPSALPYVLKRLFPFCARTFVVLIQLCLQTIRWY